MKSVKKLICLLLVFALNSNVLDLSSFGAQFKNAFFEAIAGEQLVSGFLIAYNMPIKIIEGLCKSSTSDDRGADKNKTKNDERGSREGMCFIMTSTQGWESLRLQCNRKAIGIRDHLSGKIFNCISEYNISSIIKRKTKLATFYIPLFLKYLIALSLQNMPHVVLIEFENRTRNPAMKMTGFFI